tara:strand:- start:186 stop:317 length:132 start_codon:yes stop_codon:yes gene_type:complete
MIGIANNKIRYIVLAGLIVLLGWVTFQDLTLLMFDADVRISGE